MESDTPLLELSGIVKQFPGCLANDHVSLAVRAGSIHALLGENGAGKSTLVKIIYGILRPDEGHVRWQGREVEIASPRQARALGIGMVFQHFSLFESLTVAENIALGLDHPAERVGLAGRIVELSSQYGLTLDPTRVVHELSVGERQRIEIVRCLLQKPKLLIMDEPTSVLTPQEANVLFTTLRRLASEGCAILYISHKLDEIRALCQSATIMRGGRVVGACDPREKTTRELAELMVGSAIKSQAARTAGGDGKPRLVVDKLTLRSHRPFGTNLEQITFSVASGEILGIAGIAGNGQAELMDALTGETFAGKPENVIIDGVPAGHLDPIERRRLGVSFVPEERNGHGAVGVMSLFENAFLSGNVGQTLSRWGVILQRRTWDYTSSVIESFDVRTTGPAAEARALSGGNLQKFVVGREVALSPGVLIVSQPTWGVDAGAVAAIHQSLLELAAGGAAVLVISQDLDEIFALADRIAVIAAGRVSVPQPTNAATIEQIGLLMGAVAHAA